MWYLSREREHLARNGPKVRDRSTGKDARVSGKPRDTWLICKDDGRSGGLGEMQGH